MALIRCCRFLYSPPHPGRLAGCPPAFLKFFYQALKALHGLRGFSHRSLQAAPSVPPAWPLFPLYPFGFLPYPFQAAQACFPFHFCLLPVAKYPSRKTPQSACIAARRSKAPVPFSTILITLPVYGCLHFLYLFPLVYKNTLTLLTSQGFHFLLFSDICGSI